MQLETTAARRAYISYARWFAGWQAGKQKRTNENRAKIAFLSAAHHEPDISVEIFLLVPDTEAAGHAADAAAIYAASRGAAGS